MAVSTTVNLPLSVSKANKLVCPFDENEFEIILKVPPEIFIRRACWEERREFFL